MDRLERHRSAASKGSSVTDTAHAPQDDTPPPAVSIVLATYNRPAVLAFAIRSVLAQDVAGWELIVVGDRCSEATGVLVGSFAGRRIRYVNLALNTGEQSGPNNVGIARARGRHHRIPQSRRLLVYRPSPRGNGLAASLRRGCRDRPFRHRRGVAAAG
jgi:glycosyltransferase involved in cell wall biosynthesis